MKSKKTAIILALTLGIFGVNRFYLGQTGKGLIYLALSFSGISIGLSILDALIWSLGSNDSFDSKYNKLAVQREILEVIKNK